MNAFSFTYKIEGYGLIKAEAKVTVNMVGKVTGIEMKPEDFAGVKDRWSLVQEIEEVASSTYHAMYVKGETIDAAEVDYRKQIEREMNNQYTL